MLKVSYVDRVTNNEVLKRMHTQLHFRKDMWRRKMEFCRSCSESIKRKFASTVCILERNIYGKRLRGRPRLTWTDDIMKWTNLKKFGVIKRVA